MYIKLWFANNQEYMLTFPYLSEYKEDINLVMDFWYYCEDIP